MNLQGSQRGGAKDLALHLLKDENEHVEVHEIRGFVSDNLISALHEAYAISRGTKAKQFLFSVSLNPPPKENVTVADFEAAISRVEDRFGLTDQPRAIVFHEKKGRRHAHAVWSRIDAVAMKAIPLPFTRRGLKEISRELYLQHNWEMPRGYMRSSERDPTNFTMAQWQQAKRVGKDPRDIKTAMQDCWAVSDNQATFAGALNERGYTLAKGDRRGFVAIDHTCNVYSVSKKWIGASAKDVRAKLTDQGALPSVDDARAQIARDMAARLSDIGDQHDQTIKTRLSEIENKRIALIQQHTYERQMLKREQKERFNSENLHRRERYSKGWRGIFDRITGKSKKISARNEAEAQSAAQRDERGRDALIFKQLDQRRSLQTRMDRLNDFTKKRQQVLTSDIQQYREIQDKQRDVFKPRNRNNPEHER